MHHWQKKKKKNSLNSLNSQKKKKFPNYKGKAMLYRLQRKGRLWEGHQEQPEVGRWAKAAQWQQ